MTRVFEPFPKHTINVQSIERTLRLPVNDKESKGIEGTLSLRRGVSLRGVSLRGVRDMAKEGTMEESQHSDVAKKPKKSLLKMYTSVLSSPPMLLNLLHVFLNYLGISSFYSLSTDRAIKFGGVSKAESSLLLSIIGVSNCLGRVVFGHLLDRWKQHFFMNNIVMYAIISGFVHGHFS